MYRINDRTIQEVLQTLDKVVIDVNELARWTWSIEATAKSMSDDKTGNITFEYFSDEKIIKFFVKDAKSMDNLLKSIQIHLPLIPESVQGFFSVFKYNL
ncbi:MAG TPA: hypothetical protein VJS91_01795, partial [Nitrososphaeraceae archaeon]|nr:hypothetical protein [Nitrososphaeraceae archaeon]